MLRYDLISLTHLILTSANTSLTFCLPINIQTNFNVIYLFTDCIMFNSSKPNNVHLTAMWDPEKQIVTIYNLEPTVNMYHVNISSVLHAAVISRRSEQPASRPCVRRASCTAKTTSTSMAAAPWPQSSTWMSLWPARSVVPAAVQKVSTACRRTPRWTPLPSLPPPMACPTQSPSSINPHTSTGDHQTKICQHVCAHMLLFPTDLLICTSTTNKQSCSDVPGSHLID